MLAEHSMSRGLEAFFKTCFLGSLGLEINTHALVLLLMENRSQEEMDLLENL